MNRILLSLIAVSMFAVTDSAEAGILNRCCQPAPTCCAPAPTCQTNCCARPQRVRCCVRVKKACCAPAPTCCPAPVQTCCAPAPVQTCCAPAPVQTCCAPAPTCCQQRCCKPKCCRVLRLRCKRPCGRVLIPCRCCG